MKMVVDENLLNNKTIISWIEKYRDKAHKNFNIYTNSDCNLSDIL